MRLSPPRLARALLLLGTLLAPGLARADLPCPASNVAPLSLPQAQQALRKRQELVVVAFGSSTTQGWMASDAGHSYPAVMQEALEAALPRVHVAVINRGIGGQDAAEEISRLDADVLAIRPQLVIWQVGANGALRDTDLSVFRKLVTAGVSRMHALGVDVVLMDNQRAPMILAAPEHLLIDRELSEIAEQTGAGLFSRARLMDDWKDEGQPYERFISADKLHHNDLGYACLGRALAAAIATGLHSPVHRTNTSGLAASASGN